jgi:mannose-6-phosphate isomerase-like protein (cupin superfamily)
MRPRAVALVAFVAACGPKGPPPSCATNVSLCGAGDKPVGVVQPAPIDAAGPSQDEKLAAIQKAMNELDEGAQLCWAIAATERFDITGQITAMIDIGESGVGKASIVNDSARSPKLSSCLVELLGAYRWAPPLYSDTIQLPFGFKAPGGQSVIDRKHVDAKGQATQSVAVLLDEANTGNAAASMFELAIAANGKTGARIAERDEVWYFLATTDVATQQRQMTSNLGASSNITGRARLFAGDMMFVPKGAVRELGAQSTSESRAVVVMLPGGREGAARAGALPTPEYTVTSKAPATPVFLRANATKTFGPATIYLEPAIVKGAPCAASILALGANAKVPEHVHANETELLYFLEGSGTITIAGQALPITSTSVVQIPPNTPHAFETSAAIRAVQLYTPAGPEQRFKKKAP